MSIVPPKEAHVTYQLQYRACGKASCKACRAGQQHGPYWYAFWREARRLRSAYIGKVTPPPCRCQRCQCTQTNEHIWSCHPERSEGSAARRIGSFAAAQDDRAGRRIRYTYDI